MAGFRNIREFVDAYLNGGVTSATFRKTYTPTTVAGTWQDLSMVPGIPNPQYYASNPLEAATINGMRGVFHGDNVTPAQKYIHELAMMSTTTGFIGTYRLMDYLLYYPFIDLDDTADQTLDNTVTLPRYTTGVGVQAMMVTVAPTIGGGTFTFNYTNQDGNPKTSPVQTCSTVALANGQIVTSQPGGSAGYGPFLVLANGDTGVRSIESITMVTPAGGLGCLVLVKPIQKIVVLEAGTPAEVQVVNQRGSALERIYDGAYLNFICHTVGTATATNIAMGRVNFIWG